MEIAATMQGKSKEEMEEEMNKKKAGSRWKKWVGLAIPMLLCVRWLYVKYKKSQSGSPDEDTVGGEL